MDQRPLLGNLRVYVPLGLRPRRLALGLCAGNVREARAMVRRRRSAEIVPRESFQRRKDKIGMVPCPASNAKNALAIHLPKTQGKPAARSVLQEKMSMTSTQGVDVRKDVTLTTKEIVWIVPLEHTKKQKLKAF